MFERYRIAVHKANDDDILIVESDFASRNSNVGSLETLTSVPTPFCKVSFLIPRQRRYRLQQTKLCLVDKNIDIDFYEPLLFSKPTIVRISFLRGHRVSVVAYVGALDRVLVFSSKHR